MHHKVIDNPGKFVWIDIVGPEKAELESIANTYGLHPTSLADCLDPFHLPKSEKIEHVDFVIVRAYDSHCHPDGDTVQELTRKIAIFIGEKFLITVHRAEIPFLVELRARYQLTQHPPDSKTSIVWEMMRSALKTFEKPLEQVRTQLERLETDIFTHEETDHQFIEEMYYIKRKGHVFKRVLRLSTDILDHYSSFSNLEAPLLQDIREMTQRLYFYGDDLVENVNSLLNHYLSLSSHRTNEIIRVLTIFSAFFLPLTFLVGIYGMNFQHMPELHWAYGYPLSLGLMGTVCLSIFIWFKRKKWI